MVATLPKELVTDVLERLPTKSLIRFKSVEQSWNALFKTVIFVKKHSQRLKERVPYDRFLVIGVPRDLYMNKPYHDPSETMITLISSNHPNLLEFPPTKFPSFENFRISSNSFFHCNGIIYFYSWNICEEGVLWNPATKEAKLVPPPPLEQQAYFPAFIKHGCVFGADPYTFHDFKIIKFFTYFLKDDVDIDNFRHISIQNWGQRLFEIRFEIWIFKQGSNWTKVYKVGPFYNFLSIRGIWNDVTEFLIESSLGNLVSYKSDGQAIHHFPISSWHYNYEIRKYVESMAPLSL
ncbi:hypothetical protein VNO77_01941 [Canavalia gladiata]|uniref:F-box domain-containing protein n=1 Tax=Canavalia gladiata TaxID=3824 RepID=A0AAN9MST9_CANGL